jgi:uncharacterized protein
MNKYYQRLIENEIKHNLNSLGAVVVEGPKWCGKSTTCSRFAKKIVQLQNPIVFNRYRVLATTSMVELLEGEKPLLFDEWQKIPDLWDFVRLSVDESQRKGQYILTGSAKPLSNTLRHTGTGRFAHIRMRTMSLWESDESNGKISLARLFSETNNISGESNLTIRQLAFLICRGGWPGALDVDEKSALNIVSKYYQGLVNADIADVDGIKRDPSRAKDILKSYARNISSMTSYATMISDVNKHEKILSDETFFSYLRAFEKLYVIENIQAWSPSLRSKTTIRTSDKKQFVDPSVATAALAINPDDLMADMETMGFFFESLCERDLRIYIESLGGTIHHYFDKNNLEIDAIVRLPNGQWGAIEIKLGGNQIDNAARNLLKLKSNIDTTKMSEPAFLMVLTGYPYAMRRPDGVLVVPLGCLKN